MIKRAEDGAGEPRGSGRDAEQGETVWPGCCRAGQAGSLGTGDCGIGESEGRGSGRTVGALKAGGKNTASRGRVPRTAGQRVWGSGCRRGYLRGRMATMRVPPVYPESMYISPCRWVTIRRQR